MVNIKNLGSNLLNVNKISFINTDVVTYHIKYIAMKSLDHANIDCKNYLYLIFNHVDGYIEESNGNKYLIFASTDKNKEILEKYTKIWNEIQIQIKTIDGGEPIEYKKDFVKIRFE